MLDGLNKDAYLLVAKKPLFQIPHRKGTYKNHNRHSNQGYATVYINWNGIYGVPLKIRCDQAQTFKIKK